MMTWRAPYFDLASGLFVPQPVTWDPETGELTSVEGPKGFATWEAAETSQSRVTLPRGSGSKGGELPAPPRRVEKCVAREPFGASGPEMH
jgi:hypothetical protein